MRSLALTTAIVVLSAVSLPACASSPDEKPFDQNSIAALEQRISQAQPASNASSTLSLSTQWQNSV